MENKIQLSKDEIIMGFVASCVEDVADTLCVDYSEVYQRMGGRRLLIFSTKVRRVVGFMMRRPGSIFKGTYMF